MDCSFLVNDCFSNGVPCSENQLVVGRLYKSVDHGELRAKWKADDLSSRCSTRGGVRSSRGGGLRYHVGGRWRVELGFRSRECFPYEKMGIAQFPESSP